MATTTKSTARKKTKTTRKVSAASTRKTATKKAAPKKKTTAAKSKTTTIVKPVKTSASSTTASSENEAMESLRSLNFFVVFASAVQAGLILWLSKAFGGIRAVTTSYPTSDTLASASSGQATVVNGSHRLFDVHLSWMIAAFFIVMAVMHLAVSTWMRKRYERELSNNLNRMRWATYAVAGSLLLMTIALTATITDLSIHLAIIGFTVVGSLAALSREHFTQNRERSRLVYGIGAVGVLAPWVIFLVNILGTHQYGAGGTATYLFGIYATGFILALAIARNLREQTRARGRWIDYIYAEKVYIWLNLIGYSAVAWQIYSALLKK